MRTTLLLRALHAIAALAVLASIQGCYSTHDPGARSDGGPAPSDDAAVVRRDGGLRRDAGPPPSDCRDEVVAPYAGGVGCSDAVSECIRACSAAGEDCAGECIEREPECQRCFYQNAISCANDAGCAEDWRTFACCTETVPVCRDVSGVDRFACAGSCMAEIDRYSSCLNDFGMMCFFVAADGCNIRF